MESIEIQNLALSTESGKGYIYIEQKNKGNSSLDRRLMSGLSKRIEISTIDAKDFFNKIFQTNEKVVMKSDMQGYESRVHARISKPQWDQVLSASIEIWATSDVVESDVETLIESFQSFDYMSWYPKKQAKISRNELKKFWLRNDNSFRNLYLSRKLES